MRVNVGLIVRIAVLVGRLFLQLLAQLRVLRYEFLNDAIDTLGGRVDPKWLKGKVLHDFVFIFGVSSSPCPSLNSIWEHILVLLLVRVLLSNLASASVEAARSGLLVLLLSEVCILLQVFVGLLVDLWRPIRWE
jgi:hypothetical protein